jgi:ribosomal protein L37E
LNSGKNIFAGRKAMLVSMHKKEKAIAPALKKAFQIELLLAKNVNTDSFGTFSGEIERIHTHLEAARNKIKAARKLNPQMDLFIASEGSFFPHPDMPQITLENELIVLYDAKNSLEITASGNYIITQVFSEKAATLEEIIKIAENNNFPKYGIILKCDLQKNQPAVIKNITSLQTLKKEALRLLQNNNEIIVESDLRAHKNPQRMKNIAKTAQILVQNMQSFCPACGTPGFSIVKNIPGLPCAQCGFPTRQIRSNLKKCNVCNYELEINLPQSDADPMYCDNCNP